MADRVDADDKNEEEIESKEEETSLLSGTTELFDSIDRSDSKTKLIATIVISIILPACLVLFKLYTDMKAIHLLGYLVIMLHGFYFIYLYFITFTANNLFRIRSIYEKPTNWLNMTLASKFMIYDKLAIESISEMSANRGSILNYSLFANGVATYLSYLVFYIYQPLFLPPIHFIFIGGGPVGILLLAFWEKDDSNIFHSVMHFIGIIIASFSNIGLLIAFISAPNALMLIIPIFLIVFGLTSSMLYGWVLFKKELPSNDPKYINSLSKKLIIFESCALAASLCAYDIYLLYTVPLEHRKETPAPSI